jgi:hypothetical protein
MSNDLLARVRYFTLCEKKNALKSGLFKVRLNKKSYVLLKKKNTCLGNRKVSRRITSTKYGENPNTEFPVITSLKASLLI